MRYVSFSTFQLPAFTFLHLDIIKSTKQQAHQRNYSLSLLKLQHHTDKGGKEKTRHRTTFWKNSSFYTYPSFAYFLCHFIQATTTSTKTDRQTDTFHHATKKSFQHNSKHAPTTRYNFRHHLRRRGSLRRSPRQGGPHRGSAGS